MSKKEVFTNYQFLVFQIYDGIYQNELFFEKNMKNHEYQGYLIEKYLIDKIKKDEEYEKIKPLIGKRAFGNLKGMIKDKNEKIDIIPKKYIISDELTKELNKNNSFYIIYENYINKIIRDMSKFKGYETKFLFDKDNNVTIIFNENDKLHFGNNKSGIIEKKLLLDKNLLKNSMVNSQQNIEPISTSSIDKMKFKDDLGILIRIFFYNKYLIEKENNFFEKLNKENNCESVYLINKSWMEEYKNFFYYKDLEDYLTNKREYFDLFIQNNYYFSDEKIKHIMDNIPPVFINKIQKKDEFNKNKTFEYEKMESDRRISYLYNNYIINHKIYESLTNLNYKLNDSIKKIDLYFIGSKKILLLNREDFKKEVDEIGFINEQGLFVPEYLLEYVEKNTPISLDILNIFFINTFSKFCSDQKVDSINMKDEQNKVKGHCFKLNNKNKELEIKKVNIIKEEDKIKDDNNHGDKNDDKKLNFVTQGEGVNKGNNETTKQIDLYIELMINIYLFKEELKNKINQNLVNTHEESYYIIRQKWMEKLKHFLDYDRFVKYLELGKYKKIIDKYNPINNYNEFISGIINLFPPDYTKDILSKTEDTELRNSEYYSMKWKQKNNLYFYYDNIEIINEKITEIVEKLFNIEYKEKRIFLLGDKKIIMDFSLEYETSKQFSIITGDYTKDYFETDFLLHFFNKQDIDNYFKIFTSKGYDYVINNLFHPQNKEIYMIDNTKSLIGRAYKIYELWKKENTNNINQSTNIIRNIDINIDDNDNNGQTNHDQENSVININQIQLNLNMKSQIKALISYYLFTEDLKQKINEPGTNLECYLVDQNWMKKYTQHFSYNEIIQQITKYGKNEIIVDKIYEKFDNDFLSKFERNETKKNNFFGDDISKILNSFHKENFIESAIKKDIIKYNNFKFNILNEEVFKYMNSGENKILTDVKKKEYLINEGKIFIKLEGTDLKKYEILICCYNSDNYEVIPQLLLKYESKISMINDFDYLKKKDFTTFKCERITSGSIALINKNNNNEKLGTMYDLQSPKLFEQINNNETNINNNQENKIWQDKSADLIRVENGIGEIKNELEASDQTRQVLSGPKKTQKLFMLILMKIMETILLMEIRPTI